MTAIETPPIGTLYVCGTPIGNLADMTLRALETLKTVSLIAAEDTRQTAKLLDRYAIPTPTVSYHEHNAHSQGPRLIERLLRGEDVALVSDAGMPGISDPGEPLIQDAIRAGVPVVPVPGAVAAVSALVVSGLPTSRWVFEGFLPREGKARRRLLRTLKSEARTLIFYEGPHRLLDTLRDLLDCFGPERPAAVARELTKTHEEVVRGTLADVLAHFNAHEPRGEIVLIVGGGTAAEQEPAFGIDERLTSLLAQGMSKQDASKQVSKELGIPKREVYQRAHELSEEA